MHSPYACESARLPGQWRARSRPSDGAVLLYVYCGRRRSIDAGTEGARAVELAGWGESWPAAESTGRSLRASLGRAMILTGEQASESFASRGAAAAKSERPLLCSWPAAGQRVKWETSNDENKKPIEYEQIGAASAKEQQAAAVVIGHWQQWRLLQWQQAPEESEGEREGTPGEGRTE